MNLWNPNGWTSSLSDSDSDGASVRWILLLSVRRTVFGEWTTVDGLEDGANGELLFLDSVGSQSSVGTCLHFHHQLATLCLNVGLYGDGGERVHVSDNPLFVSSISSKSEGVPF